MFYIILGIIVLLALFLIFRDDRDGSYNRSEKGPRKVSYQKEKVSSPSVKQQILEQIEDALNEARKGFETPPKEAVEQEPFSDEELDLSFLDDIEYSDELEENTETFNVAGLPYYCTVYDCGKTVGVVVPEPSNVHDSRAQAVIRNDGKRLGYIPRNQLDWYEDLNKNNVPCPFVGEIGLHRSTTRLYARIKVILPSSREVVEEEIGEGV